MTTSWEKRGTKTKEHTKITENITENSTIKTTMLSVIWAMRTVDIGSVNISYSNDSNAYSFFSQLKLTVV